MQGAFIPDLHTSTCILRPATIFYQLLSIGPFPKKVAPKTSLQGPLWPSSKIFWLKHCKSVYHFVCCFCHCFNLGLFLQDHGFDPPYGSNHLQIVNFLYAYMYIETSTLRDSLWYSRRKWSQKNTTHCEDQRALVKLVRVTLYWTYGDFYFFFHIFMTLFFFLIALHTTIYYLHKLHYN